MTNITETFPAIGIVGADGRMGRAIAREAGAAGLTVAGGVDRGDGPEALAALAGAADVVVDFSTPDALAATLAATGNAGTPLLVGTTGLQPDHHAAIDQASRRIAIIQAANTSLGVNLLRGLVARATAALGPDWDIELLEMHHRAKIDAPSGTALLLAKAAAEGRGSTLQDLSRFDRISEHPHQREEGTIGYASLRGGSVAGDHVVILAGDGERIELGHRADSRRIFARGAIRAARWLAGRAPGRYDMTDVLGL